MVFFPKEWPPQYLRRLIKAFGQKDMPAPTPHFFRRKEEDFLTFPADGYLLYHSPKEYSNLQIYDFQRLHYALYLPDHSAIILMFKSGAQFMVLDNAEDIDTILFRLQNMTPLPASLVHRKRRETPQEAVVSILTAEKDNLHKVRGVVEISTNLCLRLDENGPSLFPGTIADCVNNFQSPLAQEIPVELLEYIRTHGSIDPRYNLPDNQPA